MSRVARKESRGPLVIVTTTPFTVLASHEFLLVDASAASATLDLPAVSTVLGQVFSVTKTDSSTNTVTLDPSGAETIQGVSTWLLYGQGDSVSIVATASGWRILAGLGATVSGVGQSQIPRPTFATRGMEWMETSTFSSTTTALTANQIYYQLHSEDQSVSEYDAIIPTVASGAAGALFDLALYSLGTDRNPLDLLWSITGLSAAAAGPVTALFSAGVWTLAGASYRNAANNLVLSRGRSVWRAFNRNPVGGPSMRSISPSSMRSLGRGTDAASPAAAYRGFTESRLYASGFPAVPITLVSNALGDIPILTMRWL